MCNSKYWSPKMPSGAMETQAPAAAAGSVGKDDPDLEVEDEGSTRVKRDRTRRGGLRIDINMGGGGRSSRGTNVPR